MKRFAIIACLLAALIAQSSAPATGRPATERALLRLLKRAPVTVSGVHFRRAERVRVTVYASVTARRFVRTTATGSFVVTFLGVYAGRCSTFRAVAIGALGDSALLKLLPLPACISQ